MTKILVTLTLLCASLSAQVPNSFAAPTDDEHRSTEGPAVSSLNPVLQWNRILLAIVRTPGAQPATIHTTPNFAPAPTIHTLVSCPALRSGAREPVSSWSSPGVDQRYIQRGPQQNQISGNHQ